VKAARLLCLALVVVAAGLVGCGSDRPLVVVRLAGAHSGYKRLAAIATLNGADGNAIIDYLPGNDEIGVELPAHARGALQVIVGGYDTHDCIAAIGWVDVDVVHDSVQHATVTLQAVTPVCM
jgi:hypothetical protein